MLLLPVVLSPLWCLLLCGGCEGDLVAEFLELANKVAGFAVVVEMLVEVVRTEIMEPLSVRMWVAVRCSYVVWAGRRIHDDECD